MTNPRPDKIRVAIVGSRGFGAPELVQRFVRKLAKDYEDVTIISGGARGVDSIAVDEAIKIGLKTQVYPANWDRYGRRAGIIRNYQIITDADEVAAFWDGESAGTAHSARTAFERDKLSHLFADDGSEISPMDYLY